MTWTTGVPYPGEFGRSQQMNDIYAYISAGSYTDDQKDMLAAALLSDMEDEVNSALPEGARWVPETAEIITPIGRDAPHVRLVELPDEADMRDLFAEAWQRVEARYAEIERVTLGG